MHGSIINILNKTGFYPSTLMIHKLQNFTGCIIPINNQSCTWTIKNLTGLHMYQ